MQAPLKLSIPSKKFQQALLDWYDQNPQPLPWRELWKKEKNPYHIWLSEIMLQQTVIKAVIPKYHQFLAAYPTLESVAAAEEAHIRQLVTGLGYYRRFNFFHQAAQLLTKDKTSFSWPTTAKEWKMLPGIGDYTSAAVASIAFNDIAAVVDGNVERVFCRLLNLQIPPNHPHWKKSFQQLAPKLISKTRPGDFNQAIMELGQQVCRPKNPNCELCPFTAHCMAYSEGTTHLAPAEKIKPEKLDLNIHLYIPLHKGKIGLYARPVDSKFFKSTLGFATAVQKAGEMQQEGDYKVKKSTPLSSFKHSITRHRIVAEVHQAHTFSHKSFHWLKPKDVEGSLLTSLDKKAWAQFQKYETSSTD